MQIKLIQYKWKKNEFCNVWHAIISLHVTFWATYPCYTVCFLETITKLESKFLETTLDVKDCATRPVAFIIQDLCAVTALSTSWVVLKFAIFGIIDDSYYCNVISWRPLGIKLSQ